MWEPEAHTEDAVLRIGAIVQTLGLNVEEVDIDTLGAISGLGWDWAIETIRGLLHRKDLPDDLEWLTIRLALGKTLELFVGSGILTLKTLDNFSFNAPILTQLTMGDTSQHWDAASTPQARLERLAASLCTVPEKVIWAYRRLPG